MPVKLRKTSLRFVSSLDHTSRAVLGTSIECKIDALRPQLDIAQYVYYYIAITSPKNWRNVPTALTVFSLSFTRRSPHGL